MNSPEINRKIFGKLSQLPAYLNASLVFCVISFQLFVLYLFLVYLWSVNSKQ